MAFYGSAPVARHLGSQPQHPQPMEEGKMRLVQGNSQRRSTFNIMAFHLSLFLPWLLFVLVSALLTWKLRYLFSLVCWLVAFVALIPVFLCGYSAYVGIQHRREGLPGWEPSWLAFIFVTSIIAWLLAVSLSNSNYNDNLQGYYDILNLGTYQAVDVATTRGQQVMDAGVVNFTSTAHVDFSKAMSFKDTELYCVAPIISGVAHLSFYDFWAVGVNCCGGGGANFTCGAVNSPTAHSGIRFLRDDERPFLRLAVQQAESTYNIRADHPLFFVYSEGVGGSFATYRTQGIRVFALGMIGHFFLQLIFVTIASCSFNHVKIIL